MAIWVLAAVLAAGFAAIGATKVLALPAMRERAARFGFSVAGYRRIGILEWAGAAGVLIGLAAPVIGLLAAAGLLLLLAGALAAHARHRDSLREAVPALVFGAVDAAYIGLTLGVLR
jgi:hypothetical protein